MTTEPVFSQSSSIDPELLCNCCQQHDFGSMQFRNPDPRSDIVPLRDFVVFCLHCAGIWDGRQDKEQSLDATVLASAKFLAKSNTNPCLTGVPCNPRNAAHFCGCSVLGQLPIFPQSATSIGKMYKAAEQISFLSQDTRMDLTVSFCQTPGQTAVGARQVVHLSNLKDISHLQTALNVFPNGEQGTIIAEAVNAAVDVLLNKRGNVLLTGELEFP